MIAILAIASVLLLKSKEATDNEFFCVNPDIQDQSGCDALDHEWDPELNACETADNEQECAQKGYIWTQRTLACAHEGVVQDSCSEVLSIALLWLIRSSFWVANAKTPERPRIWLRQQNKTKQNKTNARVHHTMHSPRFLQICESCT